MGKLSGKTAVITGGNSGIGYATAELFAAEGAKVIITGRNPVAVKEAAEKLGENVIGIHSDAGDMNHLKNLREQVTAVSASVDILFANAGVAHFAAFMDTTEAIFDGNMDINFKGAFFTIQQLLPIMPSGASIILNSTILVHSGLATSASYSASKGAVLSLAKTLAIELAEKGLRVNSISPGPISTPIYSKMGMPEEALNDFASSVQAKIPLQRFGSAQDVALAALYLAGPDSGFVTGTELTVDGGKSQTF